MNPFDVCLKKVRPLDRSFMAQAKKRLESQTRPANSLGYLEELVERMAAIQQSLNISIGRKRIYIFAGDHGVTEENVSLYPSEVTAQMVYNFLSGGATINSFARALGAEVRVVDMGVDHDFAAHDHLISRKTGYGTDNIAKGPAMSFADAVKTVQSGIDIALKAREERIEFAAVGEMGIGNTTAASAVIAALTREEAGRVTGRGTGIPEEGRQHKVRVIERALTTNAKLLKEPMGVLQAVGGFEIAGMAGFIIGCAAERIPVVVDGLVASAAALIAMEMNPLILEYVFFGHRSYERGQDAILRKYRSRAILDLDMRLGEGTGACLAMGILESACRAFNEVATFEEARVATKKILEAASLAAGAAR